MWSLNTSHTITSFNFLDNSPSPVWSDQAATLARIKQCTVSLNTVLRDENVSKPLHISGSGTCPGVGRCRGSRSNQSRHRIVILCHVNLFAFVVQIFIFEMHIIHISFSRYRRQKMLKFIKTVYVNAFTSFSILIVNTFTSFSIQITEVYKFDFCEG